MSDPYNPGPRFRPSSQYGERRDPLKGKRQFHSGQDFAADAGTPIPAASAGEVVYSGFNDNFGNTVIVKNPFGYRLYAHMQDGASRAQAGQRIWPGDIIGHVGSTGARTTGNHLHYSVIKSGSAINRSGAGGPIGIRLNEDNTVDPATYAEVPYVDQTLGAQPTMFSPNRVGSAVTPIVPRGGLGAPDGNGAFGDRFGSWTSSPDGSAFSPAVVPSDCQD